jgi:signal transduction histidine kinase
VKYTASGSVAVALGLADGGISIEVRDTGPGISPQQREHLFEPFWQAEQARSRHQGGTGLGLSVAQHLARLLGGEISVALDNGRGATFVVRLPG